LSIGVSGQNSIVTGPSDTQAVVGKQVDFSCSTSTATTITWNFTPVGGFMGTICICGLPCVTGYGTTSLSTESCTLIMSSALLGMAGLYTCAPQGVISQSAKLTVQGNTVG